MQSNDRLFIDKFENFIMTVRSIIYYGDTGKENLPINPKHDRQRFIKFFSSDFEYYDSKKDSFQFQNDFKLKYEFSLIYTYKAVSPIEMGDMFQIFSELDCKRKKSAAYISAASRLEKNINRRLETCSEIAESGALIVTEKKPKLYLKNIDLLDCFSENAKIKFLKSLDFAIKKEAFVLYGVTYKKLLECRDLLPEVYNDEIEIDHQMFHPVLDELHIWNTISAIEECQALNITYFKYINNEKETINYTGLIPLKILYDCLFGRSYLYLYDKSQDKIITLRYDRIFKMIPSDIQTNAKERETYLQILHDKLSTAWLANIDNSNIKHVEIKFKNSFAIKARLYNEKRHGKITEFDDYLLYNVNVNDFSEMKGWILSFKNDCIVTRPQELVDEIVSTLEVVSE